MKQVLVIDDNPAVWDRIQGEFAWHAKQMNNGEECNCRFRWIRPSQSDRDADALATGALDNHLVLLDLLLDERQRSPLYGTQSDKKFTEVLYGLQILRAYLAARSTKQNRFGAKCITSHLCIFSAYSGLRRVESALREIDPGFAFFWMDELLDGRARRQEQEDRVFYAAEKGEDTIEKLPRFLAALHGAPPPSDVAVKNTKILLDGVVALCQALVDKGSDTYDQK